MCPTPFLLSHELTGRGTEEDSEIIHGERRGDGAPGLSAGLDGALFGHVAGLATVVAVDLAGLAALYGDVSDLSAPVALDLLAALLDVSEAAAGVALLLVSVLAVAGHMTGFATVVADLLALLLGLLAVPGDVSASATVVARILGPLTVPGHVSRLSTAIAEEIFPSATTLSTAAAGVRTVLDPVARAAATEALAAAHSL